MLSSLVWAGARELQSKAELEKEVAGKRLEGLEWHLRYAEHAGNTKSCLDFLGVDVSEPWLYGGTAQAFVINIEESVNVTGPIAWDIDVAFGLTPNVGFTVERLLVAHEIAKDMPLPAFREEQRTAWDWVRARIDRGLPCYGWELIPNIPNYTLIAGYDHTGYLYQGWEGGHRPWEEMGLDDVRAIDVCCVHLSDPAPDTTTVCEALATVLDRAYDPEGWTRGRPRHRSGPAAFALWADALESGRALRESHTYNVHMWLECRTMAAAFLEEARERLSGLCDDELADAAAHYSEVRDAFSALLELHPEQEKTEWTSTFASEEGADLVRRAGKAEEKGLECLRQVLVAIDR